MFIALFIRQVMNASSPLTFLTFTGSPGLLQRPVWRRRHCQAESPWTSGHWGHDSGQGSWFRSGVLSHSDYFRNKEDISLRMIRSLYKQQYASIQHKCLLVCMRNYKSVVTTIYFVWTIKKPRIELLLDYQHKHAKLLFEQQSAY